MTRDEIKAKLIDKTYEVIALAESAYDVKLAHAKVEFDLTGKTAGQALVRDFSLVIRLNLAGAELDYDQMINKVVPHEIAHLVNYVKPSTGRYHNKGWRSVCETLGGDGSRCHTIGLKPSRVHTKQRKTRKYLYKIGSQVIVVGAIRHNRINKGVEYTFTRSGEKTEVTKNNYLKEIK